MFEGESRQGNVVLTHVLVPSVSSFPFFPSPSFLLSAGSWSGLILSGLGRFGLVRVRDGLTKARRGGANQVDAGIRLGRETGVGFVLATGSWQLV